MPFTKGNTIGNRFKKGEVSNPKGRQPKLCNIIGDIPEDAQVRIMRVLHHAIALPNIDKAKEYIKSESENFGEYGYILQIAIRELNGARGWQALNDILDRLFGKPRQSTDVQVSGSSDDRPVIRILSRNEGGN